MFVSHPPFFHAKAFVKEVQRISKNGDAETICKYTNFSLTLKFCFFFIQYTNFAPSFYRRFKFNLDFNAYRVYRPSCNIWSHHIISFKS